MAMEIRRATEDDLAEIVAMDFRNFGQTIGEDDVEVAAELLDLDRFLVGTDDGRAVAAGGSFGLELTVPGGALLPMSGITWVSVLASHRRQGLLRRLMAGLDELAAELGDPVLGLQASEGPIYERFGYGTVTRFRVIELDRRRAQIDPRWRPEPVVLVDAQDHVPDLLARYDRYRRSQPGEVSRPEALFRDTVLQRNKPDFAAIHPDGYAVWAIEPHWNDGHPAHLLQLKDLIAATPAAYVALWHLLLSVDLVGPIRSVKAVGPADPLPYLLTDQRALRTVEQNDGLWLKVADTVRCFGSRTYRTDDRLVIGVVDGLDALHDEADLAEVKTVETVAVGPHGCVEVDEQPDLVACRAALGPLLLGVGVGELVGGRRVRADGGIIDRADALLGTGVVAHCRSSF